MNGPPPATLQPKVYAVGEMACLASPPSWEAPIVMFKEEFQVVTGLGDSKVIFIWPAWNEYLDYGSAADPINPNRGRVWLVWHEGVLWYPTIWYSPAHIGIPPPEALSHEGQPAGFHNIQEYEDNYKFPPGQNFDPPQLINRGGSIRVWLRVPFGAEESYSDDFWSWQDFAWSRLFSRYPVTKTADYCDGAMELVPFHLKPNYYYSGTNERQDFYIPGSRLQGRKIVALNGNDSAGKYVNYTTEIDEVIKQGQNSPFIPTVYEPVGWDVLTGRMQSKIRGAELSPYYPEKGSSSIISYTDVSNEPGYLDPAPRYAYPDVVYNLPFQAQGASYNLWQKLARTDYSFQSVVTDNGNSTSTTVRVRSSATITEESPPAGQMFLVHPSPIPGYTAFDLSSGNRPADYVDGGWFAQPKISNIPPYEVIPPIYTSSGSGRTFTSTSTQDWVIVSRPVHPVFARRTATLSGISQTEKSVSFSANYGGYSTFQINRFPLTVSWTPGDSNKILDNPPSWVTLMVQGHVGTPTEVPPRPLQFDSQKVVGGWQQYGYFYTTGWSTQYTSFQTSTSINRPAWLYPEYASD